ncbi:hypothetical protein QE422_003955 [Chryseobacterium sp. SORGH_AS 447]|uniref:hypothetical protein n=1 Tax=Chryseobacterium sp. SORGH_AS_0447 TaxID=3041769 RepID=UPI00277E353E|nr:hypothetical protein [Chryseobacterium sp. SORGH_AS_0447]MDQ1163587.1 hypothetical protein [Chryseobacterium sp. SORGH_AS_0447]
MKDLFLKTLFISGILFAISCHSQTVVVRGIARDSLKINNAIGIVINDTIRKFRDKALEDEEFKKENWYKYDGLVKKFMTTPDFPEGNYEIKAKLTDTLYFHKLRYSTQKYKVADIIHNNIKVVLAPTPCIPFKKCDHQKPSKLYTFVGKKIEVKDVDQSKYCGLSLSSEYKARYAVEEEFSEHYPDSEIVFSAYNHNSMYEYDFRNYEHILLFVKEYCGDLVEDYFFPVYKTEDGRWAASVDPYMEDYYKPDQFPPVNILFDQSVAFNLLKTNKNPSEEQIIQLKKFKFPEKYYKIENGKAIPVMGRYAENLVQLWKEISKK